MLKTRISEENGRNFNTESWTTQTSSKLFRKKKKMLLSEVYKVNRAEIAH